MGTGSRLGGTLGHWVALMEAGGHMRVAGQWKEFGKKWRKSANCSSPNPGDYGNI
jgi:hypothetical protein